MFRNAISSGAVCAALLLMSALPAKASVINWTLQDVTFTDGGTATGTFSTDATDPADPTKFSVVSFDVTTTAGTKLPGLTYDATNTDVYPGFWGANTVDFTIHRDDYYLELAFANPLTTPGVDPISTQKLSYECDNCYPYRIATRGEIVSQVPAAVPEPATWAILLAGLLGLGIVQFGDRMFPTHGRA